MKAKLLIAGAVIAALITGVIAGGYLKPAFGNASSSEPALSSTPRASRQVVVERTSQSQTVAEQPAVRHHRTWERQVLIVAGSSGAGAGIGAIAGGKKGAGIGALSGGVAGLIYNLATRNK